MAIKANQTIAERSVTTNLIVDALAKQPESISYEELNAITGVDVKHEAQSHLQSAKRIVVREYGFVYETVRGVGLRRMEGSGLIGVGMASLRKINGESKRGLRKMECADISAMDNAEKIKFNAVASGLGALSVVTEKRSMAKLEAAVSKTAGRLALQDTLSQFR